MKSKQVIAIGTAILITTVGMTGCGKAAEYAASAESVKTEKPTTIVNYSAGLTDDGFYEGITATDYVTLPDDYMAIPVDLEQIQPDEFNVSGFMQYLQSNIGTTVEITDRAAQLGDNVTVSYVGRVDGKTFVGGTADHHYATLGMNDLIDGFEEQIVGHKPGDQFTVKITFPEDYEETTNEESKALDLAGKEGQFDVTLESIDNVILEDSAVAEYFDNENETLLDGTKVDTVEKAIQYFSERQYETNKQNYIEDYLIENSTVNSYPQSVLGQQYQIELQYAQKQADTNGYDSLTEFLSEFGYESTDDYLYACQEDVESGTKRTLILQAIAEQQGIKATESSYKEYFGGDSSLAIETYGEGFTAQLALDYEVVKELGKHLVITEAEPVTSEEVSSSMVASSTASE